MSIKFVPKILPCVTPNHVVASTTDLVGMPKPKVTRFELELLEQIWKLGAASVREVQESLPEKNRPAYTTVQTMMYRMEEKKAVRRTKKIGNAHIFEPLVTRKAVYRRLIDDLLDLFGGSPAPVMSHLVDSGKLSLEDIRAVEKALERLEKKR
jgi:BlaI family transcriptional regulator, penicillinase repressor